MLFRQLFLPVYEYNFTNSKESLNFSKNVTKNKMFLIVRTDLQTSAKLKNKNKTKWTKSYLDVYVIIK